MTSTAALSIEHTTILDAPPCEVIDIAARLGCSSVSIMPERPAFPEAEFLKIVTDTRQQALIAEACRKSGVGIHALEAFFIVPGVTRETFKPFFDLGANIGARAGVTVICDPDLSRAGELFAWLCEDAREAEMAMNLEYVASAEVGSLADSLGFIERAGNPDNARVVVDILHHVRSGQPISDIADLDPALIGAAQICDGRIDAAWDHYVESEQSHERMVPGEGDFPLAEFLRTVPRDAIIGIEVPLASRQAVGVSPFERSALLVAAARRIIEQSWR